MEEPKGFVKQKEVALMCGVCSKTISNWKRRYDFPKPVKVNGKIWYWSRKAMESYVDQNNLRK